MCTPIVIDTPSVDLSGADTKTAPDPAGTGTTTPGPDSVPPTASGSGTPAATDPAGANPDGPKAANGVPINGGVALPEVGGPAGAAADTLVSAGTGDTGATGLQDRATGTPDTGTPQAKVGDATNGAVDQNTLLINSLTTLAHQFSDSTAGILQAQSDATSALTNGFLNLTQQQKDAMTAADQLKLNTGQAARKPSYSLSMDANKRADGGGVSSTMLTGPAGVPTSYLSLGRQQLLGGVGAS